MGPFGDTIANEFTVGHQARAACRLPRDRRPGQAAVQRPSAGRCRSLIVAGLGACREHGLIAPNVLPAPSAVVAAFWRLLLSGELVRNMWVSSARAFAGFAIGGAIGFALGLANGLSAARAGCRHHPADDPQHPASGADSAGHPVVRHRRGGQALPGRARRVLSRSTSTPCSASGASIRSSSRWAASTACAGSCSGA